MPDEVCVSFYLEVSPGIPGSTQSIDFRWRIEAGRRGALGLARRGRRGGEPG